MLIFQYVRALDSRSHKGDAIPSSMEKDICSIMCVCCPTGSFVFVHSYSERRYEVSQFGQQVEESRYLFAINNRYLVYTKHCYSILYWTQSQDIQGHVESILAVTHPNWHFSHSSHSIGTISLFFVFCLSLTYNTYFKLGQVTLIDSLFSTH